MLYISVVDISLEHTGESSVLSILKCVRLVLGIAKKHHEAPSSWLDTEVIFLLSLLTD